MTETMTQEIVDAFYEHHERTGKFPTTLRVNESTWQSLRQHYEDLCHTKADEEVSKMFMGAQVKTVTDQDDPMGFLRYSMQ